MPSDVVADSSAAADVAPHHIQAAVRLRPLLPSELDRGEDACLSLIPLSEMGAPAPSIRTGSLEEEIGGPGFGLRACVPLTTSDAERRDGSSAVLRGPRVRPAASKGIESARARAAQSAQHRVQEFRLDMCLGPAASQEATFAALQITDYCDDAMDGLAATILCFGQTGSGKTFTLSGGTLSADPQEPAVRAEAATCDAEPAVLVTEDGLQYRAVNYLVGRLAARRGEPNVLSAVAKCSYVELYNESLDDLLQGTSGLKCRWSAAANAFFVENCLLVECRSVEDFLMVLRQGQASRHRAGHLLNADSSRSHVLFTVYIETSFRDGSPSTYGKLTFVDLAGSERLSETGSDGEDTKSINKSLFALGHVIESLSRQERQAASGGGDEKKRGLAKDAQTKKKAKKEFVPYRSSVLTRLLMDSLGGRCRTLMVACVTPSSRFYEESLKTLRYAQRTRCIAAAPVRRVNVQEAERFQLRQTLRELERENDLFRRCLGLPPRGSSSDDALTADVVTAHLRQMLEAYARTQLATAVTAEAERKPTSAPAEGRRRVSQGATRRLTSPSLSPSVAAGVGGRRVLLPPLTPTPGHRAPTSEPTPAADDSTPLNAPAPRDHPLSTHEEPQVDDGGEDPLVAPESPTIEVFVDDAVDGAADVTPDSTPPPPSASSVPPRPHRLQMAPTAATAAAPAGFSVLDLLNALPDAATVRSTPSPYGFRPSKAQ